MKVYIATRFRDGLTRATHLAHQLREHGHVITYEWWKEAQAVGASSDGTATLEQKQLFATKDVQGVKDAEVLVVLAAEGGKGMHAEMGVALALGIQTIVVGEPIDSLFYFYPGVLRVEDTAAVFRVLRDLEKAGAVGKLG